jgi:acyl-CoA synthetase (AMP-forming)/AMP-acid ligase II
VLLERKSRCSKAHATTLYEEKGSAMSLASSGVTYAQLILNTLSRYPEREAFVQDGRTYTYAQALDLLRRIRTVFANHGVGPGSAVGALG